MTTSETYEDALSQVSSSYANEFTDYSGTMSYLDDVYEDEIDDLISGGVSYFPSYPTGQAPVNDFFGNPLDFLHGAYSTYVPGTASIGLRQMAQTLGSTAPSTTFGQMMGHMLKGNSNAVFSSLSDAATAAKVISQLTIGTMAMAAAGEVFTSQDPLTEGQKQGFTLGGMLLGGEIGSFIFGLASTHPAVRGAGLLIGVLGGTKAGRDFFENQWPDIHDDIVATAADGVEAMEIAYQAAKDYVADIWDDTGQAAQDLFDDFLDGVDDFVDDLGELAGELGWAPPTLPGWMDVPLGLFGGAKDLGSPLVLDLDSDGIELTSFTAATTTSFFDIDGDSFAEQTAWVSTDDGLLARDVDENGKIDDVTELFGSPTIDGFAKLALLDSNGDSIINQYDEAWGDLLVWQDANGDAISQASELFTLDTLGIVSIDLAGVQSSSTTINGSPISHTSTFKYSDGSTDAIVDAWFTHDDVNTQYAVDYTLDEDAIFLPSLRGFGKLPSLHVAMSGDSTLLGLVEDLADDWTLPAIANPADLQSDVEAILFRWAGVDGVSTSSRGININARRLEFMEELFGDEWKQLDTAPNPGPVPAAQLNEAFIDLYQKFAVHLLVQLGWDSLFVDDVSYDVFKGDLTGTFSLSESGIDALISPASQPGVDAEAYWLNVMQFIDVTTGFGNLTTQEEGWLDDAIYASDSSLTLASVISVYEGDGTANDDTWSGTSGSDTYDGGAGDDELNGGGGDDTLYGNIGSDTLDGGQDNDTLFGGTGNDVLYGYIGNDNLYAGEGGDYAYGQDGDDSYHYTGGDDVYYEQSYQGSDKIVLPSGITLNDLSFHRLQGSGSYDNLKIEVGALGTIEIQSFFDNGGNIFQHRIEEIEFSDSSTFDLVDDFSTMVTYGTDVDDFFAGAEGSSALADAIYGYGGNDELRGDQGNDTLDGGAGNDELWGGGGDDTFIFSPGFDEILGQGGTDTIVIPESYTLDDLKFFYVAGEVLVQVDGLGQASINSIEDLYFEENAQTVLLSSISIEQRGTAGNDTIFGLTSGVSTDDILNGMGGDDILHGGTGNDTYVFSEGQDIIYESASGASDKILFWENWTPNDISIYRSAAVGTGYDDLVVEDSSGNRIVVESQFDITAAQIEYVEFSDLTIWDVLSLSIPVWGTSGNDGISIGGGDVHLYGFEGDDSLSSGSGNDLLDGGTGSDALSGGAGNDTYVFSGGVDTITEVSGDDVLVMTGGMTVNDITFSVSGQHLNVAINGSTDKVVINSFTYPWQDYKVETIKFDDGFYADLPNYNSWTNGTSSGETLNGNASDNTIIGFAGNDTINGAAGADHAHGGTGNDVLSGGDGDDLLHGGDGDDTLYGEDGLDTLFGGDGEDTFVFEAASAYNDVDVISDFDASDDVIDITDLLSAYDPMSDAITDFVQITDDGTDSTLAVDADGGADNFVAVASVLNATGLTDEAALVSNGTLLAA